MVAEFVVVAKSIATITRRSKRVEFAPTTGNAFANTYNVVPAASTDYNMRKHCAKRYHFGYFEPCQSPVAQKLQRR